MLDVKKYVYGLLKNSAALVSALGSADKIVYWFPQTFASLGSGIVSYKETNQYSTDDGYSDNGSFAKVSEIEIAVFTPLPTSTSTIAKIVDGLMEAAGFNIDFSGDMSEPENRIQHRVMRYSRKFVSGDL